jgi:hypothetical protein
MKKPSKELFKDFKDIKDFKYFNNLKNEESDEDEDEEEEDQNCGIISTLSIIFIISAILTLITLIFYRDSRPNELKSVFEPFDNYLSVPQDYLNNFIKELRKILDNKEEKERQKAEVKLKMWDNQQVDIDLIKLRLDWESRESEAEKEKIKKAKALEEEEIKFWKAQIEIIEKEIMKSKEERVSVEKELLNLKDQKSILISSLSGDGLNEQIKKIKEINFMPLNVEEFVKDVYGLYFKSAIIKSFINDYELRREKIQQVIKYGSSEKFFKNYKEKYFYNWLLKQKGNTEFMNEIKLKSVKGLEAKTMEVNKEFYKNLTLEPPENVAIDFNKIFTKTTISSNLVKELQELEKELFILLSKNLNFKGKIVDLMNLKNGAMDFINEFQVIFKGDFEHFDILFRRLERRINIQDQMIKKGPSIKIIDINKVFLECWHKRNLLNLFTDRRLTTFDRFQFNEIKTIHNYSEKFNVWFKEKLLGLPHEEPIIDVKKKYEASIKKKQSPNIDSIIRTIDSIPDLGRVLTKKLSIFDHSPYEFLLDRVLKDYSKYPILPEKFKRVTSQETDNLIYYTEGHLFRIAAYYGMIMRLTTNELNVFRRSWPKASSGDRSFLIDDEDIKKSVIKSIKEMNWKGHVPDSYIDLMIVEDPNENIPLFVDPVLRVSYILTKALR